MRRSPRTRSLRATTSSGNSLSPLTSPSVEAKYLGEEYMTNGQTTERTNAMNVRENSSVTTSLPTAQWGGGIPQQQQQQHFECTHART